MKQPRQQRNVVQTLAPKQQTFDFGSESLRQQLSSHDRRTCRDVIARLLYQVTDTTHTKPPLPNQENNNNG